MTPRHPRARLSAIVFVFAAVAVSFLGANAVTQHAMRRIDSASDEIAFNSAPSIQHLAALRSATRQTQFLVGALFTGAEPGDPKAVEAALATVNGEAEAYLGLPTFPGEKEYWRALGEAIAGFNGAVQRVLADVDTGARDAALAELQRVAAAGRVKLLGINATDLDSESDARGFVQELGVTFPVVLDAQGNAERAYNVRGLPTSIFVGRDGKVAAVHPGALTQDQLDAYLAALK